ncbi:MAG: hypothetical protein U5L95_01290 [Candidatus Saccharibacteria bacterium]|nr:hypothetical protein [Candidatus Saccharibacteria bacterium]
MKPAIPHNKLIAAIILSGVLASVGLIGGLGIQLVRREILSFLPLLIALPAMNAMAGDYATLTASHLGDPENYKKRTQKLVIALLVSFPVSALGVSGLSLGVAHLKGFVITTELALEYTRLIFTTLGVVIVAMFAIIYLAKLLLEHQRINIDDTLIPIANTIASVLLLTGFAIMSARLV